MSNNKLTVCGDNEEKDEKNSRIEKYEKKYEPLIKRYVKAFIVLIYGQLRSHGLKHDVAKFFTIGSLWHIIGYFKEWYVNAYDRNTIKIPDIFKMIADSAEDANNIMERYPRRTMACSALKLSPFLGELYQNLDNGLLKVISMGSHPLVNAIRPKLAFAIHDVVRRQEANGVDHFTSETLLSDFMDRTEYDAYTSQDTKEPTVSSHVLDAASWMSGCDILRTDIDNEINSNIRRLVSKSVNNQIAHRNRVDVESARLERYFHIAVIVMLLYTFAMMLKRLFTSGCSRRKKSTAIVKQEFGLRDKCPRNENNTRRWKSRRG